MADERLEGKPVLSGTPFKDKLQSDFPAIIRAAVEIAYDNGMVNRLQPEQECILNMVMDAMTKYTPEDFIVAEKFLTSLSEEQMYEICTGGWSQSDDPNFNPFIDEFLNTLFEG